MLLKGWGQKEPSARELLANDYERNVSDLISTRWFFRKIANVTESLGNVLLYFSAAAPGVAAAITPIYPPAAPFITCSGLMCLATHVCCLGCAKCGAREEGEREQHLKDLAAEIGFHVVPLKPIITDDSTSTGPTGYDGNSSSSFNRSRCAFKAITSRSLNVTHHGCPLNARFICLDE